MRQLTIALLLVLCHLVLGACQAADDHSSSTTVTLLFTNDVESAYDPIPAFWLDDQEMIGGIAEMTTLINEIRHTEPNVFLFDGDQVVDVKIDPRAALKALLLHLSRVTPPTGDRIGIPGTGRWPPGSQRASITPNRSATPRPT